MMDLEMPIRGKENLKNLLPHRDNMLLIDGVNYVGNKILSVHATLDSNSPLFKDGQTPSYVSFELIAQSISVYSHIQEYTTDDEPSIGFILKVSNFVFSRPYFIENEEVEIFISEESELLNDVFSFHGIVRNEKEEIANGDLLVMCANNTNLIKRVYSND